MLMGQVLTQPSRGKYRCSSRGDSLERNQIARSWHPCGRLSDGPKDVHTLIPGNCVVTPLGKGTQWR